MVYIARYFTSFFFQKKIEARISPVNGCLEVNFSKGKYVLDSSNVNYSFGGLHTIFQKVFYQFNIKKRDIKNVLILGFGSGSVASILQNEYKMNTAITGVEKDPVVIDLAKRFFGIDKYKGLTLSCSDAYDFVLDPGTVLYDLIVIDVFVDLTVPEKIQNEKFISGLNNFLKEGGILFYNFIAHNETTRSKGAKLFKHLNQWVGLTEWVRFFAGSSENWVFVSQKQKMLKQ
jgi:spermidine synthase